MDVFFFKQKTAYEMRISDWSSDVCSSDLGVQLHPRLVAGGPLAVLADPHVAGGHAPHAAVLAIQHLGGGEPGIDLDAELGRLLAEPAADVAEADDVVAMVVHLRRRRQAVGPAGGQVHEAVLGGRRVQRRSEEHTSELQSLMRISY